MRRAQAWGVVSVVGTGGNDYDDASLAIVVDGGSGSCGKFACLSGRVCLCKPTCLVAWVALVRVHFVNV